VVPKVSLGGGRSKRVYSSWWSRRCQRPDQLGRGDLLETDRPEKDSRGGRGGGGCSWEDLSLGRQSIPDMFGGSNSGIGGVYGQETFSDNTGRWSQSTIVHLDWSAWRGFKKEPGRGESRSRNEAGNPRFFEGRTFNPLPALCEEFTLRRGREPGGNGQKQERSGEVNIKERS